MTTPKTIIRAVSLTAFITTIAACGGGSDSNEGGNTGDGDQLTMWTLESEPDRLARTERNLKQFTEQSGIEVELVPIEEVDVAQTMLTNAASGTLPDVVDHPMVYTSRWVNADILDVDAAEEVVERLDPETFSEAGLEFATVDDRYAAVPTSGWGYAIHYRKDWFNEAGLDPPETFDDILTAAETLNDPANDRYGISLANDPAHEATQQGFEHFALANGCRLLDDSGEIALDTDRCVETFEFYNQLLEFAPSGKVDSTAQRAAYLAGQAAMVGAGPHALHRFAGLEDAELPTCQECQDDPAFLAKNTGIASVTEGYHGDQAQYGRTNSLGITVDAQTESAQELVEYLLSDGYIEWLSQVPNGMIPLRTGTQDNPEEFVTAWQDLNIGVDREGTLGEFYGAGASDQLASGVENFDAWGREQGFGELVSVLYELYTVPAALRDVQEGALNPQEAAKQVDDELTQELEAIESD